MTRDRDLKRRIRALMRSAGINYTSARSRLVAAAASDQDAARPERQDMTVPPRRAAIEKFTDRSRRAVVYAQQCAFPDQSETIDPIHLLEALVLVGGLGWHELLGLAKEPLPWPVDTEREIAAAVPGLNRHIPFASGSKLVLELGTDAALAEDAAFRKGVATHHLMIGVIDVEDADVRAALSSLGVDTVELRRRLEHPTPPENG